VDVVGVLMLTRTYFRPPRAPETPPEHALTNPPQKSFTHGTHFALRLPTAMNKSQVG
jgi:hypothetical protein